MADQFRRRWRDRTAGWRATWYLRSVTRRGAGHLVWGRPRLLLDGEMQIGRGLRIRSDAARVEVSVAASGILTVGDDVHVDQGASIGVTDRVTIGDGCRIGPHVQIMDNNFHRLEVERRDDFPESRRVTIGNDVQIGPMALILPGATIGDRSVIAARSVVSGTIPAGSIAMGLPATVVDTR